MPGRYLPAWVIQLLGIVLLIGLIVYWAKTGHQSATFVEAAFVLIGAGTYQGIRVRIQVSREEQLRSRGSDERGEDR